MVNHVSLGTTAEVEEFLKAMKVNGCQIDRDNDAGTVDSYDGEARVFAAIQKNRGGPWIMMFVNSDRIKWSRP